MPQTFAFFAIYQSLVPQFLNASFVGFLKRYFLRYFYIRTVFVSPPFSFYSEALKKRFKDFVQGVVFHAAKIKIKIGGRSAFRRKAKTAISGSRLLVGMAKAVVLRALSVIGKHPVRLVYFFEFFFVAAVLVGMVLMSKLSVRFFYFFPGSVF